MKVTIENSKMNRGQLDHVIDLLKNTTDNGLELTLNNVTLTKLNFYQEQGVMDDILLDELVEAPTEQTETKTK